MGCLKLTYYKNTELKVSYGKKELTEEKSINNACRCLVYGMRMSGLDYLAGDEESRNLYLFGGKELQTEFGYENYDFGWRHYDPQLGRWHVIDPMAETYYSWSPYNYTMNNPIKFIDPNGMFVDDYSLDKETGEINLVKKTDDEHDRIVKTDKDGNMKTKKNGDAKVAIDNIEKGILSDGMNFKTDDNIIEVGGENQPSLEGVENFLVELSDYVFKENSGMYISGEGQEEISAVYIDEYKGNTERRAKTSIRLDRIGNAKPRTHFHTHLSSFKDNDKYQPSKKDKEYKKGNSRYFDKFLILTDHPKGPIKY